MSKVVKAKDVAARAHFRTLAAMEAQEVKTCTACGHQWAQGANCTLARKCRCGCPKARTSDLVSP